MVPPTSAFTAMSRLNWARFARSPNRPVGGAWSGAAVVTAMVTSSRAAVGGGGPVVGPADRDRDTWSRRPLEDARRGGGPFAVPAHHCLDGVEPVGHLGEAAELEMGDPGNVAVACSRLLAHIQHAGPARASVNGVVRVGSRAAVQVVIPPASSPTIRS